MPRTCFSSALRIVCGTVLAWPAATCSTKWSLGSRRLVVICFSIRINRRQKEGGRSRPIFCDLVQCDIAVRLAFDDEQRLVGWTDTRPFRFGWDDCQRCQAAPRRTIPELREAIMHLVRRHLDWGDILSVAITKRIQAEPNHFGFSRSATRVVGQHHKPA
jgi:hypothetical protein